MGGVVAQQVLEQGEAAGPRSDRRSCATRFEPGSLFVELQDHGLVEQPAAQPDPRRARATSSSCRSSPPTTCTTSSARTRDAQLVPARASQPGDQRRGQERSHHGSRRDVLQERRRDGARCSPSCPRRSRNRCAIAEMCSGAQAQARQADAAALPGARGLSTTPATSATSRARACDERFDEFAAARQARRRGRLPRSASRWSSTSSRQMGFAGLLPDRLGLHPPRQGARHPGRAGPRLGRGIDRRVLDADHRPRSDPVRPALRALPEPRARVDARLRHRLLHGPARRGHRLRAATSTARRVGRADRHVPRAQGAERHQGRRRARWACPPTRRSSSPA